MSLRILTEPLLAAMTGVRSLVEEMKEESPLGPTDPALVEVAIRDRAPSDEWPYWLLVLAGAHNRAIGVLEGWLDSGELEEEARDYLTSILEQALERGAGSELNEERFYQLVCDALGRPVDIDELVAPARLVIDTVLCSPDPATTELVVGPAGA